ncbi:alpha beta-hydrolase [Suillus subalutaceus]|uniref:alpha beta-hydrolase n=1 Tax=Suillus subalutaceus TaxID=48586 RepID=UPI001B86B548|nr:alpha beta-hydrolase [Suillus subalutaceus]KAG1845326.1 alpha beta-hydrolase [Suillus subalutaceus]
MIFKPSVHRTSTLFSTELPQILRNRCLSTAVSPVELAHDEHIPADGNRSHRPLLILHGLFGSKRNWQSLSKAFMRDLSRPVYTLDLRNHGSSPHVRPMTYSHMAADVLSFCQKHSLRDISLMGHSMGGKVAMALALHPELPSDLLADLIVSDIAPVRAKVSQDTVQHIRAMEIIQAGNISTRKEADEIMSEHEQDPSVRSFLLTNLEINKATPVKFKIPVDILKDDRAEIESFPYASGERSWDGRTLIIKGKKSKYINRHNIPLIDQFFPQNQLKELDTGHWVHAELPHEYRKLVVNFIAQ